MESGLHRSLRIVEAQIAAMCADVGLPGDDLDRLLREFETTGEAVARLSLPVAEALVSLLVLRRDMLTTGSASGAA